jgi:cell division transport system permease protein
MGASMQSIKNHLSLVLALLSILFSMQVFIIAERSIEAYKENLANNYSVVVVSKKTLSKEDIAKINPLIAESSELTPDHVIKRLDSGIDAKNMELLKVTLPRFYKLSLKHYPSPSEIQKLTKDLRNHTAIKKVEDFSHSHDTTYKLLLLFKGMVSVFSVCIFVVTTLLVFKELRIWQFKHSERMSIMGLFGAPVWLRSAVLFRLAIVDAIIASALSYVIFKSIESNHWIISQFENMGIEIVIFDSIEDFLKLSSIAIVLSIVLASLIVLWHKEEV